MCVLNILKVGLLFCSPSMPGALRHEALKGPLSAGQRYLKNHWLRISAALTTFNYKTQFLCSLGPTRAGMLLFPKTANTSLILSWCSCSHPAGSLKAFVSCSQKTLLLKLPMSLGSEHHLDENLGLAVELWTWKLGGRAKQFQCRQILIVTDMASYQVISNHLKFQESSGLPPGLSLRVKITLEMSSSLTVLLSKSSMSSMSSRIITLNSPNQF